MEAACARLLTTCQRTAYKKLLGYAERIVLQSSTTTSSHIDNVEEYIRASNEHQELMFKLFPTSALSSQDQLKRVAAHVGLKMPVTIEESPTSSYKLESNFSNTI